MFDYVKKKYNVVSILAEYGGDHAIKIPASLNLIEKYPFLNGDFDLTISRAQEDMNIHLVLETYKDIPERTLVVVSNWDTSKQN